MLGDKYHIDADIDKLTKSIENTISGDSFATEIHKIENSPTSKISQREKDGNLIGDKKQN